VITEEILELVKSRSSPGVLILDRGNKLLYANEEAFALLDNSRKIPPEVRRLCNKLKAHIDGLEPGTAPGENCALFWGDGESPCSLRAIPIGAQAKASTATHIMVLIEKITEQHGINLNRARSQYGLSNREIEVVALVAQGLANKEIGSRLFLSKYTIKDHLKNILRKMGAASRSEIIHLLK